MSARLFIVCHETLPLKIIFYAQLLHFLKQYHILIYITNLLLVVDDDRIFSNEFILEANIGADYDIVCDSHGPTKWFYKEYNSGDNSMVLMISNDPVLRLRKVKPMHSGHYYCYGVYPNMNDHFIAKRVLKIYGNC